MSAGRPFRPGPRRGRRAGACAARPGFGYAMFMMTATLVMLIGLASITVVRSELRTASTEGDLASARQHAIAALAHAEAQLYTDTNWRASFSAEAWSAEIPIGSGTFAWKIIDADRTRQDLTADPSSPARVYGRGRAGDTVWVYSRLVRPPPTKDSVAASTAEHVSNGDFTGLSKAGWSATLGSVGAKDNSARLGFSPAGEPSLRFSSRLAIASSMNYDLDVPLVPGQTYRWSMYAGLEDFAEPVWVKIVLDTTAGTREINLATKTIPTGYTALTGRFTPAWSGNLTKATLSIGSSVTMQDIYIDGVSITPVPTTTIGPVSGTLRREAQ